MRITAELLKQHNACEDQCRLFTSLYPDGLEPTVENLSDAVSEGLDAWWAVNLLPLEGSGSQRAYALWCARRVQHLCDDERVTMCLDVVERRVADPLSVSDDELYDAWVGAVYAARDAAGPAAGAAAWAAARAVVRDAERAAAGDAQLACLSQLLLEAE